MTQNTIAVVGSYNQDLVWNCKEFPKPGATITGSFTSGPGGKGSNQAVAASRAGGSVRFIGAVGDDVFAESARQFYSSEGIDPWLVAMPDTPTGTAGIFVDGGGENEIIVALGANLELKPEDLPRDILSEAAVVVTQFEIDPQTAVAALEMGKAGGATTILNPAPMTIEFKKEYLRHADILIPNETEFSELLRVFQPMGYGDFTEGHLHALSDVALHDLCRQFGVPTMVITMGARGAFISTPDAHRMVHAYSGIQVVDTVGAGDSFVGGLAAGLTRYDGDIFKAARYGNASAALAVTRKGAAAAMARRREIDAFLEEREPKG